MAASKKAASEEKGITAIAVGGYKSLVEEQRIDIARLTILAGANSSGKSSIMQPLLLMKQTLDAPYDPGVLDISGPNVSFDRVEQLFSKVPGRSQISQFSVMVEVDREQQMQWRFSRAERTGLSLTEMVYRQGNEISTFTPTMSHEEIEKIWPSAKGFPESAPEKLRQKEPRFEVKRDRFSFRIAMKIKEGKKGERHAFVAFSPFYPFAERIAEIIHVPAWRGSAKRAYPAAAVRTRFPGVFSDYVASTIHSWKGKSERKISELGAALSRLGLTWKVETRPVDDTKVEVLVGRLREAKPGGARDMVPLADVGFGVSQVLPVLVALLEAKEGQLVYIEEPEIHLHPRAQVELSSILVSAANRGVRVVVETHSPFLLLALQAQVAKGNLPVKNVKLHWFSRTPDGRTAVTSADLDETGAFGDWPVDFGDIELGLQREYLDAVEPKLKVS